ncbi:chromate transporter [Paenibacillus sp. ClWae2A]|uniref:chromate transporter n=1 Tax=Paenibacillus sp. ClWae2A TaxID=3057177 RepID=UPI0028F659D0|nr:chromate transporter [Paenibacillus sp. ClWae2A]MDT9719294.1 chromate transporter [Paenibacillus sp. ClWae2A]
MLWDLFFVFLKIGAFSFGGGYAVMTLIEQEVTGRGWIQPEDFQEIVALAGMAPGSIATNTATLIGYDHLGITGAIISTVGIIFPSLLIVIACSAIFLRLQHNVWLRSSFYGLRPIVTGLIVYAAIHFGVGRDTAMVFSLSSFGMLLLCAGSLIAVMRYKIHPFAVILMAAAGGIILF